jgi:hypothetical protein
MCVHEMHVLAALDHGEAVVTAVAAFWTKQRRMLLRRTVEDTAVGSLKAVMMSRCPGRSRGHLPPLPAAAAAAAAAPPRPLNLTQQWTKLSIERSIALGSASSGT